MTASIRPRERFSEALQRAPNPIWQVLENYFQGYLLNPRPPEDMAGFPYIQSVERRSSFRPLKGHQWFSQGRSRLDRFFGDAALRLGPVESDLLSFVVRPNSRILALVGGMGSGKSTTLRYLTHHFLSHHAVVIYCDLDRLLTEPRDARSEKEGEAEAAGALAEALSTEMSRHSLLSCEDELQGIWSWALSDTLDPKKHPSIQLLAKARDRLKLRHGAQWRSEAKDVLKTRRELCEELRADPLGWLRYQHLLVDYYLTVKRGGDRSRLIIILDNADPLPPVRQRAFLALAQRMASTANCKIIFALRPLTYNLANIQAASSVLSVVEQWGPEVIDVIANRMQQFLEASEEEVLQRADLDEGAFPLQFYEESVGQVSLSLERESGPGTSRCTVEPCSRWRCSPRWSGR